MLFTYSERVLREGLYIARTGATVRATAKKFGISKTCVHKDVSERLMFIDKPLYEKVKAVLKNNFSQKHLRGGLATKLKYQNRAGAKKEVNSQKLKKKATKDKKVKTPL